MLFFSVVGFSGAGIRQDVVRFCETHKYIFNVCGQLSELFPKETIGVPISRLFHISRFDRLVRSLWDPEEFIIFFDFQQVLSCFNLQLFLFCKCDLIHVYFSLFWGAVVGL